jgi:signal transduction histidine kinase
LVRPLARDSAVGRDCVVRGSELPPTISPTIAQELYRIAQEALNNALKHSGAGRIVLETRVDPERVTLAIEDDGVGLADGDASTGVGLTSMRSRAARIGGIITLGRGAQGGTQVIVTCARTDAASAA